MKKAVMFAIFLFFLAGIEDGSLQEAKLPWSTVSAASSDTAEAAYVGAIDGDLGIHMRLRIEAGKVMGSYYYDSIGTDIALKGMMDGPQIRLQEYDAEGKETGRFYGAFVALGRVEGVWAVYNPEREGQFRDLWLKIYPFYVRVDGSDGKVGSFDLSHYKEAWEGTWRRSVSTSSTYGEVRISFATDKSFWFEMFQFAGANSRQIRGLAVFEGDGAVFRNGRGDEMRFGRREGQLYLETNEKFSYNSAGVVFDGAFTRDATRQQTLAEIGVLASEAQEDIFKGMTGRYYEHFIDYFHMGGRIESLDGPEIKAFFGYIRGVAPHHQGVVLRSENGTIWAALLTYAKQRDVIMYFTSEEKTDGPIPKTIEKWITDIENERDKKLEVIRHYGQRIKGHPER